MGKPFRIQGPCKRRCRRTSSVASKTPSGSSPIGSPENWKRHPSSPNVPPGDYGDDSGGGVAPDEAVGTLVAVGADCSSDAVGSPPAEPPKEAKVRMDALKERLTKRWASKAPQVNSQQPAQPPQPSLGHMRPKLE